MPDIGFTHVALPVTDLETSADFYARFANLAIVHRRRQRERTDMEVAWLSDRTRPFVLVLAEAEDVGAPLGPFAHLGIACGSRQEVDRLCEIARREGALREEPRDYDGPAGYLAMLSDPDGHTLELSYGQETALAVETG
jgi:catechol 2,3-dioxygenase-like lactoylglutathione lyase family enzyme